MLTCLHEVVNIRCPPHTPPRSHTHTYKQAMYQLLDEHFIGLIFSVFNSDAAYKAGRVQVGDSPQSAAVSACPVHVLHHHPHHMPAACQAFALLAGVQLSTHSVAPGWLLRSLSVHTAAWRVCR